MFGCLLIEVYRVEIQLIRPSNVSGIYICVRYDQAGDKVKIA